MTTDAQRRVLWAIIAVAAALRLVWALAVRGEPPVDWFLSGDQYSYYRYGIDIAEGRGYVGYLTGEATAYYPIGYPALLGALYFVILHTPITDDLMLATALFHVILSTATVGLLYVVARTVGGVRVGLIAAALLAVFPNIVYQVSTVQLETAFTFGVLAALAIIVDHDWSSGPPSTRRLVAFGLAMGLTVVLRPFVAVLFVGLLAAFVVSRVGWRRLVAGMAIPLLLTVALSVPWTIRNAVQMDAFIPSSTNMGDTLCIDRNLEARGGFRFAAHDGCVDPALPEVARNRGNTKKAIEFVLEHPERELLQILRRAKFMFQDDHDGIIAVNTLGGGPVLAPRTIRVTEAVADWYFYAVVGLTVVGLPMLMRGARRAEQLLVFSGLAGLLVIPLLLWGNPRFHLPLAPFLALAAAVVIERGWARWERRDRYRRSRGTPPPR